MLSRTSVFKEMRDKYPLPITEAEVLEAAMDLNFEFFANLIRFQQPMTSDAREAAADIVLKFLNGEWSSKRSRGKSLTLAKYFKIAERVAELKEANGLESAITQVASEMPRRPREQPPVRTVWKAWEVRCARDRSLADILRKTRELQSRGAPDSDGEQMVQEAVASYVAEVNRLLKRRG